MKLSNAEEQLMEIVWKCGTAFLKDIMEELKEIVEQEIKRKKQ